MCERSYGNPFKINGRVKQNLKRSSDHVVLRKDSMYLYPVPIHTSTAADKAHNQSCEFLYHDHIMFHYMYNRYFKIQQMFQGNFSKQKKLYLTSTKCGLTLKSPPIYIPIRVFTSAVQLPMTEKLESQYSFIFKLIYSGNYIFEFYQAPLISWDSISSSWVSSTIYYINCSKLDQNLEHFLDYGQAKNSCQVRSSNLFVAKPVMCLDSINVYTNQRPTPLKLSIYFKNISKLYINMHIGVLSVSNIWGALCGNESKVYYWAEGVDFYLSLATSKITCAELVTQHEIHTNHFLGNNSYELLVQVADFQYAQLNFHDYFWNSFKENVNEEIAFRWKDATIYDDIGSKNKYKLFVKETFFSWLSASKVCILHNMTLPVFLNNRHMRNVLAHVQENHGFQPNALFIGKLYDVSFILKLNSLYLSTYFIAHESQRSAVIAMYFFTIMHQFFFIIHFF